MYMYVDAGNLPPPGSSRAVPTQGTMRRKTGLREEVSSVAVLLVPPWPPSAGGPAKLVRLALLSATGKEQKQQAIYIYI